MITRQLKARLDKIEDGLTGNGGLIVAIMNGVASLLDDDGQSAIVDRDIPIEARTAASIIVRIQTFGDNPEDEGRPRVTSWKWTGVPGRKAEPLTN